MNNKAAIGLAVAAMLLTVMIASVAATDWSDFGINETPESIDFVGGVDEGTGDIDHNSLNYALFEEYGPLLLILALLMFGAMIGGVCIARERGESDDSD